MALRPRFVEREGATLLRLANWLSRLAGSRPTPEILIAFPSRDAIGLALESRLALSRRRRPNPVEGSVWQPCPEHSLSLHPKLDGRSRSALCSILFVNHARNSPSTSIASGGPASPRWRRRSDRGRRTQRLPVSPLWPPTATRRCTGSSPVRNTPRTPGLIQSIEGKGRISPSSRATTAFRSPAASARMR